MTDALIDHEDFHSTRIQITLRNLTSETVVESGANLIQLLELLPNGLFLSVPKYSCALGHSLEVKLDVTHLRKHPIDISVTGNVKELEKTSDREDKILIEFKSSAIKTWKEFCKLFGNRQAAIHDFFKSVRGY